MATAAAEVEDQRSRARDEVLQRFGRSAWALLGVIVVAVAVAYGLSALAVVVVPLLIALFPAALLLGPVDWLARHRVPRTAAAALVVLGALLVLGAVFAAVAPAVSATAGELFTTFDDGLGQLQGFLDSNALGLPTDQLRVQDLIDQGRDLLLSQDVAQQAFGIASQLASGVTTFVLVLITLFFYLASGYRIADWLRGLFVARVREDVREVSKRAWATTRGYTRGVVLVGLIDAVLIGTGAAFVIGIGLALPIAVFTFLAGFIPFVGAFAAGVVATVAALAVGGFSDALIVLVIVTTVLQIDGNVVSPLVLGQSVSLHPFAILVVLAAAGGLLGLLGAVIAVPVAASVHQGGTYLRGKYGW